MKNNLTEQQKRLAHELLNRLERISADSSWAHRASGIRASLSKALAAQNIPATRVEELIKLGFNILEKAAQEIPED